jgi:hypothetical protein
LKKNLILSLFSFALLSLPSWASSEIIIDQSAIDPPPPETASIDSYLPFALLIMIVMAGYYFTRIARNFNTSSKIN